MPTAVFYGASDDLVEVEGIPGADEFDAYESELDTINAIFDVGGEVCVLAIYTGNGVWAFGVAQVDDENSLPDWPIRIVQSPDVPYSVRLEIDVPDGVAVRRLQD